MTLDLDLMDYLEKLKGDPNVFNQGFLPSIRSDYISFSIHTIEGQKDASPFLNVCLEDLVSLKPSLTYTISDEGVEVTPSLNREEPVTKKFQRVAASFWKNQEHVENSDVFKSVWSKAKSEVIIFQATRDPRNQGRWLTEETFLPAVVAIHGSFAQRVLEAHFSGKIDLTRYGWNFTRNDLTPDITSFAFTNWENEKKLLTEFFSLQNNFFEKINNVLRVALQSGRDLFMIARIGH